MIVRLNKDGTITLSRETREHLGVKPGDELLVKQRGKFLLSIEKSVGHENSPAEGVNPVDG